MQTLTVERKRKNTGVASSARKVHEAKAREWQATGIPVIEVPTLHFRDTLSK